MANNTINETRYTVGEVSKITGVPKDTLLYYDRINLLKPKYVDPETKYRYYTYEQFWHIDIIICCRNLDIPLAKIREILRAEDIDWYSNQYKQIIDYACCTVYVTKRQADFSAMNQWLEEHCIIPELVLVEEAERRK